MAENDYFGIENWGKNEWKDAIKVGTLTVITFATSYAILWLAAVMNGRV